MPSTQNGYNRIVMVRQLEAIFEQGILRPLEPLALLEHQRVRLTLEDQPEPQPAKTSVNPSVQTNDRREEFLWLANESGPYAGQWVALDGGRLIAHGPELATVSVAAQAAGVSRPLLTHLPREGDLPFGGW